MPFEPGNQLAKGGKREGAGRPTKLEAEAKETAAQRARKMLEDAYQPVFKTYVALAQGGQDPTTTRHFVDKILPDDKDLNHGQTIIVNLGIQASQQHVELESEFRADGLQIRVSGDNGQNGNGSDGS